MQSARRYAEEAEPYPISTIADLMQEDIPELKWIVNEMLPEGLAIIAGKPKVGKSWLALQLCSAVVAGKELFSGFETRKGSVLFMALEDSKRRLRDRIEKQQGDTLQSDEFYYTITIPLFKHNGRSWLRRRLKQLSDIKLVVIDTMGRFLHFDTNGKNDYEESYKLLTEVQKIAREFNVAILLVHHTRKDMTSDNPFDNILGSTAIAGVMDTMLVLQKKGERYELAISGRDIEEQNYTLQFNAEQCIWELMGRASEVNISDNMRKILECFEEGEELSPKEISERTGIKYNTVKSLVRKLAKDNKLTGNNGKYSRETDNPTTLRITD
jgi:hypothetical protein